MPASSGPRVRPSWTLRSICERTVANGSNVHDHPSQTPAGFRSSVRSRDLRHWEHLIDINPISPRFALSSRPAIILYTSGSPINAAPDLPTTRGWVRRICFSSKALGICARSQDNLAYRVSQLNRCHADATCGHGDQNCLSCFDACLLPQLRASAGRNCGRNLQIKISGTSQLVAAGTTSNSACDP